jgi:hypothetical protein
MCESFTVSKFMVCTCVLLIVFKMELNCDHEIVAATFALTPPLMSPPFPGTPISAFPFCGLVRSLALGACLRICLCY